MSTLNINGRAYIVVPIQTGPEKGNVLQVYNCQDCSSLVTDPDLHNSWHLKMGAAVLGFGTGL